MMSEAFFDGLLTGVIIMALVTTISLLAAHILRDEIGDSADSTLPRRDFSTVVPQKQGMTAACSDESTGAA